MAGTGAAGFADDLNVWWRISRLHPGNATSTGVSSVVESWGTEWQQTFNPDKCKVLVISHSITPTPVVSLSGVQLECQPYLRCLGVWIDSKLSWHVHIRHVCQRALTRLHLIQRGVAITWGFHPTIVRRLVDATVLPSLFYAAPIWCSALCARSTHLAPIDRVLRLCGIGIMGLHRTVSGEAARIVAGLIPAEFHLRERLVDFYLRHLAYGEDLTARAPPIPAAILALLNSCILNSAVFPPG